MADYSERAVCVAVNASAPTMTASIGPSSILTAASVETTLPGRDARCGKYYIAQEGDSCAFIDAKFAITFALFHQWNPSSKLSLTSRSTCTILTCGQKPVGPNCEHLCIGHAYCVPGLTPDRRSGAPIRDGTASGCSTYYTVQIPDTCKSIQRRFRVSLAELCKWNTDIESDCSGLWPGYSLCVEGGPGM
jgi:hypothetical protein